MIVSYYIFFAAYNSFYNIILLARMERKFNLSTIMRDEND